MRMLIHGLGILGVACLTLGQAAALPDCLEISGDRIHLGDLAKALPGEAIDDASRIAGFAPKPGVRRMLLFREWSGGGRQRLPGEPAEVCVVGEARTLTPEMALAALEEVFSALGVKTSIHVEDLPHGGVPVGKLVFPASNVRTARPHPRTGIVQINGYVLYGPDESRPLRFPIWVRARVEADGNRVELTCTLEPGEELSTACMKVVRIRAYPFTGEMAPAAPEAFAGRTARRRLQAGTVLQEPMLFPKQDVKSGQMVSLLVRCGQASLRLQAKSETGGAIGQTVTVRVAGARQVLRAVVVSVGAVEMILPVTGARGVETSQKETSL